MARKNQEMEVVLLSVEGRDQDDVHLKTRRHEHIAVQMAEMVCMQMVRSCMEYVDAFTASPNISKLVVLINGTLVKPL